VLVVRAVRNMQSLMLRQISAVVEDEVSEMPQPDIISQSPQQSQLISSSFSSAVIFVYSAVFLLCRTTSAIDVTHASGTVCLILSLPHLP